jgi:hypothetical protein
MSTIAQPVQSLPGTASAEILPGRRLLVLLAGTYLVIFGALMATGSDRSPKADPSKIIADYNVSLLAIESMTYAAVIACAVLVFYGAALRRVLTARTPRWTADVAFVGFVTMAWTLGSFAVTSLGLYHGVQTGNTNVVAALNVADTTNFPFAMIGLTCSMIGVGVTSLRALALPRWLAWTSIVLGAMAPLGPGGFLPFMLFPIWIVVVAAMVRRQEG